MRLDAKKFAWAAAVTMTIVYAVCAAFTALFPELAVKFLGWMLHLVNVEKFVSDVKMTFGSVILGWLPLVLYTYFSSLFFAWLYNRSIKV
jgi:hypothetical protein